MAPPRLEATDVELRAGAVLANEALPTVVGLVVGSMVHIWMHKYIILPMVHVQVNESTMLQHRENKSARAVPGLLPVSISLTSTT